MVFKVRREGGTMCFTKIKPLKDGNNKEKSQLVRNFDLIYQQMRCETRMPFSRRPTSYLP